jgi:GDPmannose 4,6-dehydratase
VSAEPRRALITGITGQDGSFLAELLLDKGYAVTGVVRGVRTRAGDNQAMAEASSIGGERTRAALAGDLSTSDVTLGCSEHLRERIELVHGDLLRPDTLRAAIERVRAHEIYHLAAPSFVPASWERPQETVAAIAGSAAAILQSVRELAPSARVFVPASGAIYGDAPESPQREDTICRPGTPYAVARLATHQLIGVLRAHDGLHASSGIVFNHESERRPERFVTRRITRAAAAISLGLQHELTLGDTSAIRDWSFAGDIVYGAWLMLQQEHPDDYVLASGVGRTVAEFAHAAFACVDLPAERYLRIDPALVRPAEHTPSVGDPAKARERLGWVPQVGFEQLVQRMVRADLLALEQDL